MSRVARTWNGTQTRRRNTGSRGASLTSSDSVRTDLRKSTRCAAVTTLRSARGAITGRPAHLERGAGLLASPPPASFRRHGNEARLACGRGAALGTNPDRHKARRASTRRHLVSPHRKQPSNTAIAARDLGNIGALFEALRYDPSLLLRRPLRQILVASNLRSPFSPKERRAANAVFWFLQTHEPDI